MEVSLDVFRRNRSRAAVASPAPEAEQANEATHALAMRLVSDPDALRLSLELIAQIRAAGLDPDDPRVDTLPAAVELAARVAREGALWD